MLFETIGIQSAFEFWMFANFEEIEIVGVYKEIIEKKIKLWENREYTNLAIACPV